jgi:catechol 2,3-dioxygenase-like lactoylglutathione lyase family enzyme
MSAIKIIGMDHIVLNVADVDRSLDFYVNVLGLKGERIAEFKAKTPGIPFPSVRLNDHTIIDLFPIKGDKPPALGAALDGVEDKVHGNLDHFCFVVERGNFEDSVAELKRRGVNIHRGPISRWGAQGRTDSVYFLDPDGNEVEIRAY